MAQQIVIKFNIGGTRYEISQCLLQAYPDSMLARSAATQWHSDPNAEIFIDRDGARFRYVLDYLRDGTVHLPVFVSKASLLLDLHFFGVPVNENAIVAHIDYSFFSTSKTVVKDIIQSWENEIKSLEDRIKPLQKEIAIIKNSIEVMSAFIKKDAAEYTLNLRVYCAASFKDCDKYLENVGLCVVEERRNDNDVCVKLKMID
jgi:hypothetical protein